MATIFKPEEDEKDQRAQPQPSGVLSATGGPLSVASQTAPQAQPKGSGRFTNLQQYLQANQGAGQELSGRIGQKIQKDVSEKSEKAQDYYSQVREGVEKGQQVAQAGSGYQQQLQNIGQNIQDATGADKYANQPQSLGIDEFVQQPGFSQFQDIQAGRAINENLLGQRQQQLEQAAQNYLGTAQDYLGNLGTESGRFNLLKQTFGGNINPQYTAGQQRLDQMLLTEQGLMPLQQQVRQDVRSASDLQRQAQLAETDVQNLVAQEQQLIGDIGETSMANEQAYLDMLQSYIPAINEQRGVEWQQLQDALSAYRTPMSTEPGAMRHGLTPEQLQRLGVTKEMGAYNVLRDLQGAEDIASRGIDATGYQDVAQQRDLDRYNMLAQIAGLSDQQKRLTDVSQIGDAYSAKEGDASLTGRLTAADEEFNRLLDQLNYNRSYESGGGSTWTSSATGRGLFEQGQQGITSGAQGYQQYQGLDDIYGNLKDQATGVWGDFENWLKDQGYAQTIGGAVGSSGYGTRYAPYEMTMSNMPIPDKLGGNYQPDYHEIKKG